MFSKQFYAVSGGKPVSLVVPKNLTGLPSSKISNLQNTRNSGLNLNLLGFFGQTL